MGTILDYCTLVRSKNAGPFVLTFDFMFRDQAAYEHVRDAGVLTPELFARMYRVAEEQITFVFHERALALKVSVPRPDVQCAPDDTDCYAGQQYAPLLDLEI
ncbi:MAG: DUF4387 domain-containing protein [Anaerolineae bacterium]|jgi:hypothetical protein